jgi:hypothetical protein
MGYHHGQSAGSSRDYAQQPSNRQAIIPVSRQNQHIRFEDGMHPPHEPRAMKRNQEYSDSHGGSKRARLEERDTAAYTRGGGMNYRPVPEERNRYGDGHRLPQQGELYGPPLALCSPTDLRF